jgi:CheY-like chemotaxis protein
VNGVFPRKCPSPVLTSAPAGSVSRIPTPYLEGKGEFADRDKYPLPSILLLDLRMPDIDGFDVLEWIKGQPHLSNILIVVLSAYDGIREVTHAYSLGAKSFLVKPLNRLDVQNLLKAFPEHWEMVLPRTGSAESQMSCD